MFGAPTVVVGLDAVAMVGGTIQPRGGHFGITGHSSPLAEGRVDSDDHRSLLAELGH